jgi:hypothetical protein
VVWRSLLSRRTADLDNEREQRFQPRGSFVIVHQIVKTLYQSSTSISSGFMSPSGAVA